MSRASAALQSIAASSPTALRRFAARLCLASLRLVACLASLSLGACNESSPSADDAGVDHHADMYLATDAALSPRDVYAGPLLLSATGLYTSLAAGTLAADVLAYDVRFPLWSDGATKQRYLALPAGTQIDTSDANRWIFPVGTRAWKEFRVDGARVETRYFVKVAADRWEHVAYLWRADGSDADARPSGLPDALDTTHDVPDLRACNDCHRGSADGLLGVSGLQLATGTLDPLLPRLAAGGWLSAPITVSTAVPGDAPAQAALGYLHANCGHCHGDVHPLGTQRALRLALPLGVLTVDAAPLLRTALGAAMQHDVDGTTIGIVAGAPEASQLWVRMQHRSDQWQMPARGSEQVDIDGSAQVRRFIESLAAP